MRASEIKGTCVKGLRIFLASLGTGNSVAMYYAAGLGADPYSMVVEALAMRLGITAGMASVACNACIVLWALVFARRLIHIGTFIQALCVGVGIDLGGLLWGKLPMNSLALRFMLCTAGAVLMGYCISWYLACKLGTAPIDMLVLKVAQVFKLRFKTAFYSIYAVLFAVGIALNGVWGVGTIVAMLFTGWVADAKSKTN